MSFGPVPPTPRPGAKNPFTFEEPEPQLPGEAAARHVVLTRLQSQVVHTPPPLADKEIVDHKSNAEDETPRSSLRLDLSDLTPRDSAIVLKIPSPRSSIHVIAD